MDPKTPNENFARLTLIMYFVLSPWLVAATDTDITFESSFGVLVGKMNDAVQLGGNVSSGVRFLGIPYAKPPTGERRFLAPEAETSLQNLYNATYFRNACLQPQAFDPRIGDFNTDEDCLYLNIFLPGSTVSANNSYPVMVWIHGGGFRTGTANIYFSDILSSFNDVIVVTVAYRLNVLGFVDDGTGMFANNGLKDQTLAIEWVHNHIQSFGGDPSRVTLFGGSAGGVSVMYQGLYPGNQGKINRMIAQGGSAEAAWSNEPNPRDVFTNYSAKLNCTRSNTADTLACLRNKSESDLMDIIDRADNFVPTIDNDYLTMDPVTLFANYSRDTSEHLRAFSDLDFLSGFNSKDGGSTTIAAWSPLLRVSGIDINNGVPRNFFDSVFVPSILNNAYGNKSTNALLLSTIHEYVDWSNPTNEAKIRDAMVDVTTDVTFLVPAVTSARKHVDMSINSTTYMYQFSEQPVYMSPAWIGGALHTWELPYVFGLSAQLLVASGISADLMVLLSIDDVNLASSMMKYWTNFAKTGNPNSEATIEKGLPQWPMFNSESEMYIDFTTNLTLTSIKNRPAPSRVRFWTRLAPLIGAECGQQICDECEAPTSSANLQYTNRDVYMVVYVCFLSGISGLF